MSNGQPYLPRPGVDEVVIVDEMISNRHPAHWEECDKFVRRCVYARAKNMPGHLLEDMVQEIMIKIMIHLSQFRFQCALRTWVNQITGNHIKDVYRKIKKEEPHGLLPVNPHIDEPDERPRPRMNEVVSTEDAFETHEKIRLGKEALLEYANNTSNPTRNRHIIRMVLFEGKTYEEAAIATGCNAPVVGHVVREAQRYAREKMG